MNFLNILAVTFLASASAGMYQANLVVPAVETKGRITNGNTSAVGQFPYQVGLLVLLNDTTSFWCGGSLIGTNWVLTAAHCTFNATVIYVFLGATSLYTPEVAYTVTANNITIHADYNDTTLTNDISLIRIPSVKYSAKIQPVKLPAMANSNAAYIGEYAIASGWGDTSDNSTFDIINLQWARFPVISNTYCAARYAKNNVTATNICVLTRGGVSTCTGDSGGPLVLESTKELIGVISFGGMDGCELGDPAVNTRLTCYLDWIKNNTGIAY